jgi:hypothetical protein
MTEREVDSGLPHSIATQQTIDVERKTLDAAHPILSQEAL